MKNKKDLVSSFVEYLNQGLCCNDCFLNKVSELLEQNVPCNENLRQRILRTLNDSKKCKREKVITIYSFITEYK